jgi:hypothetical protein
MKTTSLIAISTLLLSVFSLLGMNSDPRKTTER